MLRTVLHNQWVQAVGALLGILVLVLFGYLLSAVLVPLFFAFIAAYIANPIVDFFERRRIPRSITITVLAVTTLLLVLLIPLFLIPNLIDEAEELIQAAAQQAETGFIAGWLDELGEELPLEELVRYFGMVPPDAEDVDARAVLASSLGRYIRDNALYLLRQAVAATQVAGMAAAQVFKSISFGLVAFLAFIGNFTIFAFVAGYLLRDFHKLTKSTLNLIPRRHRPRVIHISAQIDYQLRGFLRGQLMVMLALGIMYAVGLMMSGTPFAIIIGLMGGLASFVPYLGLILTMLPAAILTVLRHGVDWHVIAVFATFAIAQAIEGSILTPRIVGEQVGLNPVWVILAIMVFASIFGFPGLLVAIPVAAVLKVLVLEALEAYRGSELFEGDDVS